MRTPESFFPVAQFGAVKMVTPVSTGLSGADVYAVETETGAFFLRLHGAANAGLGEMLAAQRLAAKEGVAPKIIFADEGFGAVITEKAPGMPIGAALTRPQVRPLVLRSLAETLARLHAIAAPNISPADASLMRAIWDQQSRRKGFPDWAMRFGTCIDIADKALASDARRVFSHSDLNPANLLWDGTQVWLLDWEHAALAHPYMDLAIFSIFAILSDRDAVDLLAIQEGSAIEAGERDLFMALRNYARAIYGAVFFRLIPDLAGMAFKSQDATPTLQDCYGLLARGGLDMRSPARQAQFGAALLRQMP